MGDGLTAAISISRAAVGPPSFFRQVGAILWKDLAVELRTKDILSSMLVFGLIVLVIFNFAFELRGENLILVAPGVLWVAFVFAGILGLGRSMAQEKERSSMEGLLLCPVDRGAIFVAKMLGNLIFIVILEAITLPIFAAFFNLPVLTPGVGLIVVLGTLGFASVGTLFAAIAINTRAREVMLPILLFPIIVPVIIASVKATAFVLDGKPWAEIWPWVNLLIAFDVIFLAVCFVTFEYVIGE
ncbi:MAG: heme exporter protein CcmB [Chloroflexi bacterium]|nr:heme exporter protein CcmB [Chloroflexota bacterium]